MARIGQLEFEFEFERVPVGGSSRWKLRHLGTRLASCRPLELSRLGCLRIRLGAFGAVGVAVAVAVESSRAEPAEDH